MSLKIFYQAQIERKVMQLKTQVLTMLQTLLQKLTKFWQGAQSDTTTELAKIAAEKHKDSLERLIALKHYGQSRKSQKPNIPKTALANNSGKSLRAKQMRVLGNSRTRMQAASYAIQPPNQSFSGDWEAI